jgi:hypothetical protein
MSTKENEAGKQGTGSSIEKEAGEGGAEPKTGEVKEVDPKAVSDRTTKPDPNPSPSPKAN